MKKLITLSLSAVLLAVISVSAEPTPDTETDFLSGVVVFKIETGIHAVTQDDGSAIIESIALNAYFDQIDATRVERRYPHCLPPKKPNGADLTRIFAVYYSDRLEVSEVRDEMSLLSGVEYAEKWYTQRIFLDHNDPDRDEQYGLDLIDANLAHDLALGENSVPVAIVDTGMDMDHPDLAGNLWINPGEDLNGDGEIQDEERDNVDDDNNGRRDDFFGWDFIDNDNFPEDAAGQSPGHGTHTAGIASAVTNNEVGVASIGYNTGLMVVRVGQNFSVTRGWDGIEYAARAGAKVISCSWGGGGNSQEQRDVVQYVVDQDALLIASAGNNGNEARFYPAAYDDVVAVVATNSEDHVWNGSSYGNWVALCAPGVSIYSTFVRGAYTRQSGTSMSCPFVAGTAALIRSEYPELTAAETLELLLAGCEDIYGINNVRYQGKLGAGRINAYNSLLLGPRNNLDIISLEIVSEDNENGKLDPGETASLIVTIGCDPESVPAEGILAILSTDDPDIEIENAIFQLDILEPDEQAFNDEDPFVILIDENSVPHTTWLTVTMTAQPNNIEVVREFEVVIGHPEILIVDDDGEGERELKVIESINAMGEGWQRWDTIEDDIPFAETLTDFPMVIWATGDASYPLDIMERMAIEGALDEGANIMLIGSRVGDDPDNRQMLQDYFGAIHSSDSVDAPLTVKGIDGDRPISGNTQLLLFNNERLDNALNSASTMRVFGDADSLMLYRANEEILGVAASSLENEENGSKSVYFGFALEVCSDAMNDRWQVFSQLFEWFTGEQAAVGGEVKAVPAKFILEPAYPNPFNSTVSLRYSLLTNSHHRVTIIDAEGRQVAILNDGMAKAGQHLLVWEAGSHPSGVYLARLQVGERYSTIKLVLTR